jgi:hypothetical protein
VELQRVDDPFGLWRPPHSASGRDNAPAADLLDVRAGCGGTENGGAGRRPSDQRDRNGV